jgi:hypothetical protein
MLTRNRRNVGPQGMKDEKQNCHRCIRGQADEETVAITRIARANPQRCVRLDLLFLEFDFQGEFTG